MRDNTFVYLWRSIVDTSFYKNPLTCHLAIHLILSAAWKDHKIMVGGNEILIMRGQIPTGRNKLSDETGLSPQNIRTCLKHLKNSGFLTIKSTKELSIITICKYNDFQTHQQINQPTHQPSINQAPTKHQPLQNKGYKGNKEIVEYLNKKSGKNYKPNTNKTIGLIKARHNEGFSLLDFKSVIDKKCSDWIGTDMEKFLRPETLFGTKFEGYLNEKANKRKPNKNGADAFAV